MGARPQRSTPLSVRALRHGTLDTQRWSESTVVPELELKPQTLLALLQFRATTHHRGVRSSMRVALSNLTSHPLPVRGYGNVIDLCSQTCISYLVISGNRLKINPHFIKIRSQGIN
jgi:hypothetical protein